MVIVGVEPSSWTNWNTRFNIWVSTLFI
jgi:hypothetical protein